MRDVIDVEGYEVPEAGRLLTAGAGDFAPGVDNMRKAGIKVTQESYPLNRREQLLKTIDKAALAIRNGKNDPAVVGYAGDIIAKGAKMSGTRRRVQVLQDEVQRVMTYAPDPIGAEYIVSAAGMLCLRKGLCVRVSDCFPSGTLLLRDDYALVPIEEIKVGDRIWGLDKWVSVTRKWCSGPKKIDTLVLNNGSQVPLSPDHHIFHGVCRKHAPGKIAANGRPFTAPCRCPLEDRDLVRVQVRDAQVGMYLAQPKRLPFGSGEVDPETAYVDGLFLSEGWVSNATEFNISGCDGFRKEAIKHEVKAICDKRGIATRWHRKSIAIKDPAWALRQSQRGERARFKNAETLNLQESAAGELLRGIMSDSTADSRGHGRTFSTTSKTLLAQARVLQRMHGVGTSVHYLPPELHKGFGDNGLWRMYCRTGLSGPNVSDKPLKIKAIERETSEALCYDITTEDGKVYLPEHDVTVSNCDGLLVLLGSMCEGVGIHVQMVGLYYGENQQPHVCMVFEDDDGEWLYTDPTAGLQPGTRKMPIGFSPPKPKEEFWADPLDHMSGPEIVLVGVGSLATGWRRSDGRWWTREGDDWYRTTADGSDWRYAGTGGLPPSLEGPEVGAGAAVTSWAPIDSGAQVKAGHRYYFSAIVTNPHINDALNHDWTIESVENGAVQIGFAPSRRVVGIAQHDVMKDTDEVEYLVFFEEVTGDRLVVPGEPTPPGPAPQPPPSPVPSPAPAPGPVALPSGDAPAESSVGLGTVVVGAGLLALAAGGAWGWYKHSRKGKAK